MAGRDSSSDDGEFPINSDSDKPISSIRNRIENFDHVATIDAVIAAPGKFKRELSSMSASGILTRFPLFTVLCCLIITIFFGLESGINDCRDGWSSTDDDVDGNQWYGAACFTESSLNVNGDLEVYLPDDSQITTDLATIQENWTTNVMVIYVESPAANVTDYAILKEMDEVERRLNVHPEDKGEEDNVIAILSISTVVKEVNSSAVRVSKAFFSGLATATGNDELSEDFNESIDDNQDILGNYAIPENQNTIDRIIGELPENAQSKLVQGVDFDADGDGTIDPENETAKFWNRAVIIVFISQNLDKDGDGIDDYPIGDLIANTQNDIDRLGENNSWDELNLSMTLTGPVPITNAVTEYSFKLFWQIFPFGIIAVSVVLFLFHCDILQTGRMRPIQGIKVVIISGLPTLCSVLITLGLIGWSDKEVTMTVIIVGPIVLALGVSYGLHITNRYAESEGTPQEKMSEALQSTGRAVFLSAVTTIIGFISLTFTPMAPIQTVGWGLALGIVVVYFMTMLMVPNLTMLLDLKKPSHPPLGVFKSAVNGPVNYSSIALALFLTFMLVSAMYSRTNVEENIELLEMAPDDPNDQQNPDYDAVRKMKQYSDEFEAGQAGFILVEGDLWADPSFSIDVEDPFENLQGIDQLESDVNLVNQTTGVSVVFLMKSISVSVNVSGYPLLDQIPDATPEPIKEVADLIFGREAAEDATFWEALQTLDSQDANGGRQSQNFLLYVFYNSLTVETRELFISSDYEKSLIYIDMPFMDVQSTKEAVDQVNRFSAQDRKGDITAYDLSGVAAVTIAVNAEIVDSQWTSLLFALLFTLLTLGFVFRDGYYAFLTTLPVVFTVAMQWMVMDIMDVELSLVTVMIGSILVGVGVDFSIHIGNRVRELGGDLDAIRVAASSTGMSLVEAAACTLAGLGCALLIPIPAIKPFIFTIMILLIVAAISALLLLPAIYAMLVKVGWGLTGGSTAMSRKIGLNMKQLRNDGPIDARLPGDDVW